MCEVTYLVSMLPPMLPGHLTRVHINPPVAYTTQPLPDDAVSYLVSSVNRHVKGSSSLRIYTMIVVLVIPILRVLHVEPTPWFAEATIAF